MPAPVVFVAQQYLRIRRSGATGNNLGGVMYSDEIPETALHNSFPMISELEAKNGMRDYVGLYLLNTHPSIASKGLVMFSPGTSSTSTDIRFGIDPQGIGDGTTFGIGQTVINKNTIPVGVIWKNGTNRSGENALIIPDLPSNRAILIWYERSIVFGSQSAEDDKMPVIIDTNNIVGDTGIADNADTAAVAVTGQTEVTPELSDLNQVINSEHFLKNFFFLGNTTSASDVSQWINNIAKYFLKDIMKFCFGLHDVKTTTKRNQIINGIDTAAVAGYQSYNRDNINYTIIDTSSFQLYTNPSNQYNKIVEFLENANRNPKVDFIIVMMGTTPYASLPTNDTDVNIKIDTEARKVYHSLFTKYGVHLVIGSGINNYQRHHILGFNANTPDSPTLYFTSQAPNYIIAAKQKNFGNTGSIYVNVGSGTKKPLHNVPSPKTYTAFSYIPQGVGYLKIYTTRRTATSPPILEGRFYDYYVPPATTTTSALTNRVKTLVDKFTITFAE